MILKKTWNTSENTVKRIETRFSQPEGFILRSIKKNFANKIPSGKENFAPLTHKKLSAEHGHSISSVTALRLNKYDAMLATQGGHCAVCPATEPGRGDLHFHIDHEHVEGYSSLPPEEKRKYIRGLLCNIHNILAGQADDDPELLMRLAAYLTRRSK